MYMKEVAKENFRKVHFAYQILSDETSRESYDNDLLVEGLRTRVLSKAISIKELSKLITNYVF